MNELGVPPLYLVLTIVIYFIFLYGVAYFTSRGADTQTFFSANKKSPWIIVAIGMIGASLSGVTFISVPGLVGTTGLNHAYSYMQMIFGFLVGYAVIALVLMPIYYKKNLVSIYGYLDERFGNSSYKMGAFYFILSRVVGASFRLYLVAIVLHPFVLQPMGVSFEMTIIITLVLIWVYTYQGGIKTIVWTDTIQTVTMILAVVFTVIAILSQLDLSLFDLPQKIDEAGFSQVFFFENGWSDSNNFFKQFLAGALIAIVMTGLDQDMMQKNLTCRSLGDAQKNVLLFSVILVFANMLFLTLGAILYIFAAQKGIEVPQSTDQLYPLIALNELPTYIGIMFVIGLIAAAYSSADSALTSLTTSFCIDFLGFDRKERTEESKKKTRLIVHVGFTVILFVVILLFNQLDDKAVITKIYKAAGYTYGPLLGLFSYGILTKRKTWDKWVPLVVILSPILTFILDKNSAALFDGLSFGNFILAVNGLVTFVGLWILSLIKKK